MQCRAGKPLDGRRVTDQVPGDARGGAGDGPQGNAHGHGEEDLGSGKKGGAAEGRGQGVLDDVRGQEAGDLFFCFVF